MDSVTDSVNGAWYAFGDEKSFRAWVKSTAGLKQHPGSYKVYAHGKNFYHAVISLSGSGVRLWRVYVITEMVSPTDGRKSSAFKLFGMFSFDGYDSVKFSEERKRLSVLGKHNGGTEYVPILSVKLGTGFERL